MKGDRHPVGGSALRPPDRARLCQNSFSRKGALRRDTQNQRYPGPDGTDEGNVRLHGPEDGSVQAGSCGNTVRIRQ